jgi:hypothetical protein
VQPNNNNNKKNEINTMRSNVMVIYSFDLFKKYGMIVIIISRKMIRNGQMEIQPVGLRHEA